MDRDICKKFLNKLLCFMKFKIYFFFNSQIILSQDTPCSVELVSQSVSQSVNKSVSQLVSQLVN